MWGDGIYAAFVSSRLASEAGLDLLAGRAATLEPYARSVTSELGRMIGFAWDAKAGLDRFPRITMGAMLCPAGWRVLENMLRGEIREPAAERGFAGIAVRAFEAVGRRAGWPGTPYRFEARTDHGSEQGNVLKPARGGLNDRDVVPPRTAHAVLLRDANQCGVLRSVRRQRARHLRGGSKARARLR